MAQDAKKVKAALDLKGKKEKAEQPGSSAIHHSNLAYVPEKDPNKPPGNKVLGEGGCGVVYLGTYRQVQGHVAIKELFIKNASDKMVAEFENEAQIMEKLRSDYLVQFYGYCLSPTYCLVMEFMPEGSLFDVLHSKKTLDWGIRYQMSIEMSLGLEYLHDRNILHRDIKSLNVLLKNGHAKLSDFGQSRIKIASTSGKSASSIGTVRWKAPELFKRGNQYTQQSDIYSLGMTFWEIASRKIPFLDAEDNDMVSVWAGQGERETVPPDCPKKFSSLIFSCWKGEGPSADKLWKGKPSDRPTARQITDYLRSNDEDFAAFIKPKPAAESQPQYLGNLASSVVDVKKSKDDKQPIPQPKLQPQLKQPPPTPVIPAKPPIPAKPSVVSPTQPYTPQYQAQSSAQPAKAIVKPKVNPKEVQEFLNHVAWGRQDEAAAMLKANKELADSAGIVTDHAKRTFKNITGLQYAAWALDWKMWTMLLSYLPNKAATEQAKGFNKGSWIKEHGEHVTWKKLTDAQQVYIDNDAWSYDECKKHWVDVVGAEQFHLPMHGLQEYNNPNRPFEPCPNFSAEYTLQRALPGWLSVAISKGKFDFGILRYNERGAACGRAMGWFCRRSRADWVALISLYDTRVQQRGELVVSLGSELSQAQKANLK